MNFSVIGSGSWGTAVSYILASNGHDVKLYSRRVEVTEKMSLLRENADYLPGTVLPDNICFTSDLKLAVTGADIIIMAVPSHAVRQMASEISQFCKTPVILNIAKGIEQKTHLRMSQVIGQEIPGADVAVMSGPSHAEEVVLGMPTTNIVSSRNVQLAKDIQHAVMTPMFRLYTNDDIVGVEIGGALKNVIALCAGICDGLGFGDNTKAALMTRGIAEITRLGCAMGAKRETFAGLSGIGDLIVTCTSMHSRNRRAGILIGKGMTADEAVKEVKMVVEGIKTADAAYALSKKYNVEMPIVSEAYRIVFENKPANDAVLDLMIRNEKSE